MIVGLGQFGMGLARSLSERGVEVLAVDRDDKRVREAAQFITEALCFDAKDEEALARTAPSRRDACVCAIGDEATEAAIICTALLKQLGARRLVARASSELLTRILHLVGADSVVNPERDFGQRFATILLHEGVLGELALGQDLVVTELLLPEALAGRSLIELELPKRHGITVVAVRAAGSAGITAPDPRVPLDAGDALVVVSKRDAVTAMLGRL